MSFAQTAPVIISSCALLVSGLSYRTVRRVARESGWRIRFTTRFAVPSTASEPLKVVVSNEGRAAVEVIGAQVLRTRATPNWQAAEWTAIWSWKGSLTLAGGHSLDLYLDAEPHPVEGGVPPPDAPGWLDPDSHGQVVRSFALLSLGSGETLNRIADFGGTPGRRGQRPKREWRDWL